MSPEPDDGARPVFLRSGPEFRADVRSVLAACLDLRRVDESVTLLGAGEGPDAIAVGRAFLAALQPHGLATPNWPHEHGGAGLAPAELSIFAEELARFDVPDTYPFSVGLNMAGSVILKHGDEQQQRRWLPSIQRGEEIWCQMFSEPDAGSDLAGLTTRASLDRSTWSVTGQKLWTSRAHFAQWGLLLARTDPTVPKHCGLTAFAIQMSEPGISVRPLRQINGDEHFSEVFLNAALVPDEQRIGAVGDGWKVAITTLMHERAGVARAAGITREHVLTLLRQRGARCSPQLRDRGMRIIVGLELHRLNLLRARAAEQRGATPGPEGSGGKLRWAQLIKDLSDLALELLGPEGMLDAGEWQTIFLTSPSLSIRGGTDEIQRNILGERVLGLPGEPRTDRDVPFTVSRNQRQGAP